MTSVAFFYSTMLYAKPPVEKNTLLDAQALTILGGIYNEISSRDKL